MSKAAPAVPALAAPDFDSPDYEDFLGDKCNFLADTIDVLSARLLRTENAAQQHTFAAAEAVDFCINAVLTAVEMQYVAREDDPISTVSVMHGSWEPEQPPEPCSMDSWLRAAMPEAPPSASITLTDFLNKQPSVGGSKLKSARGSVIDGESLASYAVSKRRSSTPSGSKLGGSQKPASPTPGARSPKTGASIVQRQKATLPHRDINSEDAAQEDQLRQEVAIRRQQEQTAKALQAKDAAERSKLGSLAKSLKGKEYTYDHRGQMVVISSIDPEKQPLDAVSSAAFRVAAPGELDAEAAAMAAATKPGGEKKVAAAAAAAAAAALAASGLNARATVEEEAAAAASGQARSIATAASTGKAGSVIVTDPKGRKLVSDFQRTDGRTQPSALKTMAVASGVTLKQGNAAKVGPAKPKGTTSGMSRDEFHKSIQEKQYQLATSTVPTSKSSRQLMAQPSKAPNTKLLPAPSMKAGTPQLPPISPRSPTASAGPLTDIPEISSPLVGAKPRVLAPLDGFPPKPPTPDVNPTLTTATDWGSNASGVAHDASPSLPANKPDDRQRASEVGRTARLPRDRAQLATISPPLSPVRTPVIGSQRVH